MYLIFISIAATLGFGIFAIILSLREEKAVKKLIESQKDQKQRLYETTVLKEIQERIGYSPDVEKVLDVITGSADNLLSYSTISTIIVQNDKLLFKTHVKEAVNHDFIEATKASMLKSLETLQAATVSSDIEERISGVPLDQNNHSIPSSLFNIPLMINDRVVAIINVASSKTEFYKEEESAMLKKVTDLASQMLSHLENILSVEKGKLIDMVGSLADGLFMLDIKGQIVVMNQAAKSFLHIDKINPNSIDVLSSLPNTYDFSEKLQRVINHKRPIEEKEVRIGDKTFQFFITPVFDATVTTEKKVIGVSVVMHDITLEHSLAKMKEDFTNVMVHELRSPLTAIKASTELLKSSTQQLSDEERAKIIRLISDQSRKMLDEVSLILDAAKLESGLFTITKLPGDLKKLINDKVDAFTPQAHEKFVNLVTDVDPSLPNFAFDPIHIDQVINNLISNSLKFTPSGGTVHINAKTIDGNAVVVVSDTGVGIPKEKQHLLFSKFTQISSPTSTVGTGLGLYIVKGVVEAHGGTVMLESEEEKGTKITFTLPIEMTSQVMDSSPILHNRQMQVN